MLAGVADSAFQLTKEATAMARENAGEYFEGIMDWFRGARDMLKLLHVHVVSKSVIQWAGLGEALFNGFINLLRDLFDRASNDEDLSEVFTAGMHI